MNTGSSAQPTLNQAYTTPGNPTSQKPNEAATSQQQSPLNADPKVAHRGPNDQPNAEPTPSALGRGQGAKGDRPEDEVGYTDPLEGEQMHMAGEGKVMAAQWHKTGFGEQESLTRDLESKKEEQREEREKRKEERSMGILEGAPVDPGT